MKVGIICSERIENEFGLRLSALLQKEKIPFIMIHDYPVYLKDSDLSDHNFSHYIAIAIHSLDDHQNRFTVHPCGNWGSKWQKKEIHLGGEVNRLSMSSGLLLSKIFGMLKKHNALPEYKVSLEATHHGPDITKPIIMLEIGSDYNAWQNKAAHQVLLNVIKSLLSENITDSDQSSIVIGGDHYMENISDMIISNNLLVSHLCPSYQISELDLNMLSEAVSKSFNGVKSIIVDLAATGQQFERISALVRDINIELIPLHRLESSGMQKNEMNPQP